MKPTTVLVSVLSILGASTISAIPSFAQTTSIPFTGTVSLTVFTMGGTAINYTSVLSSVGTIQVANGSLTAITTSLAPLAPIVVGTTADLTGTTTGSVTFNSGGSANFSNAPTQLTLTVTSVSGFIPYLGPVNPDQSLTGNFTGSVAIPTSSITSPVTSPITSSLSSRFFRDSLKSNDETFAFANYSSYGNKVGFVPPSNANTNNSGLYGSPIMLGLNIDN